MMSEQKAKAGGPLKNRNRSDLSPFLFVQSMQSAAPGQVPRTLGYSITELIQLNFLTSQSDTTSQPSQGHTRLIESTLEDVSRLKANPTASYRRGWNIIIIMGLVLIRCSETNPQGAESHWVDGEGERKAET